MSERGAISAWDQVLASSTGATITSFFLTPFDVVKTRLQAQQRAIYEPAKLVAEKGGRGNPILLCRMIVDQLCVCGAGLLQNHNASSRIHFTGTFDAFLKIPKYEGFFALWNGLSPTLMMVLPASVIYYTSYDNLKVYLGFREGYDGPDQNYWAPALAGVIARVTAVGIVSPIELIRTKVQAKKNYTYRELIDVVSKAIETNGVKALWRGLPSTLYRDVPFSAILWASYERLKRHFLVRFFDGNNSKFIVPVAAAGISSAAASIVTHPFDVIKTHHQMTIGELEDAGSKKFPTILDTAKKIRDHYGSKGLFAGLTARIVKIIPACAIMITTYELLKDHFRQKKARIEVSDVAKDKRMSVL